MSMQKVPETPLTCGVRAALEEYTQRLMNLYPERFTESDPEAWREEYLEKQEAGVKYEYFRGYEWVRDTFDFNGNKEDYREVQEAPKIKEIGVGIPEASREILKAWQAKGLKFKVIGMNANFALKFADSSGKDNYTIPEQPIPSGMNVEMVEAMWRQGLKLEIYGGGFGWTPLLGIDFNWRDNTYNLKYFRIHAQPIPEKLLEVPQQQQPHLAERALYWSQWAAGTNEVWQKRPKIGGIDWADIRHDLMFEPGWDPDWDYRVKPMKLTARIALKIGNSGAYAKAQDSEFTGTREEYRAECEKYGYAILSEIKEVVEKPTTVKYYFALYKMTIGNINTIYGLDKDWILDWTDRCGHTIIGNIETREVEV